MVEPLRATFVWPRQCPGLLPDERPNRCARDPADHSGAHPGPPASRRRLPRARTCPLSGRPLGSTERASALGDRAWKELLERHHALVRHELNRFRGREIGTSGDGFLATFDGPARAVRCALAIVEAVQTIGMEVRAGVHTGEIELMGEGVGGIAVHIGARVGAMAAASEVLVSATVKDLVAGSGIEFEDRGAFPLKGVPGTWRLFVVRRP